MSSLIEQAAQRMEQLRQAGAEMPVAAEAPAVEPLGCEKPPDEVHSASLSRHVNIDLAGLAAAGIVNPYASRSQTADQFRVIKRPLIRNAMGKGASPIAHGNLIMVTSALAGEGKTFTAINLAMSMATELDYTVMLVDADAPRPSVMKVLGLPEGPGLLDLVAGESTDMSNVLLKTNIEKLTILPIGTSHARATELLASEAMIQLLDEMENRYPDRLIIFDSPPLLLTTEAPVLASHMGQIVVVVQAGRTLQSEVRQALATIEACPVKLMVLNQARTSFKGGYRYGEGDYGYGSDEQRRA